ncbi:interleukin-21 [Hoplias malabaricus]|uniref:interleukin-21 n=1 Tax=Hoplias malabaricus TaxID=27720 RepID=UPI00346335C4
MRTLFLSFLCALLAMTCWAETTPAARQSIMLQSTIKQLTQFSQRVKKTDTRFYSPTSGIEACCTLSALECFRSQLLNISTDNKPLQSKLYKNLGKNSISTSLDRCTEDKRTNIKCKTCDSYPMTDSQEFLKNLLNLLQKSFIQLP